MAEPFQVRIERLSPKPGDILLFRCDDGTGHCVSPGMLDYINKVHPDLLIFLVGPGQDISLANEAQMESLGWVRKVDEPAVVPAG